MTRNCIADLLKELSVPYASDVAVRHWTYVRRVGARNVPALCVLLLLTTVAFGQAPHAYDAPASFTLKSGVLGEERTILVRTPPGYERNGQRYPVLYMTDGDAHMLHTSGTVAFLARNNRMPEMIVVGITNTDRTRDLSPTHVAQLPGNPNVRFPTSGGADKFLKFIETELIPQVEAKYRVQPFRALAGHSLGGLFAVHAMLARAELFNVYIAVSPALQWDNFLLIDRAKEFFKNRKDYNRTLFVTLGNEPGDIGDGFKLFREVLQKQQTRGFAWEAVQMEDEDHGSVVLRSHYAGLRKAFDGWQFPRDPNTGAIAGDYKAIEEHFRKLSERMGFTLHPPEALINQVGYQLMGQGKMDEAIVAFKSNVERYPQSANVYDSLAEAYERGAKLDLARPNYEKAVALGKESSDPNLSIYQANLDRVAGLLSKGTSAEKK
ncbi:MAG: alpha/beta hydrolase-fold protein [Acidobacteriota bacterium]|nr:alpha/beta hydrolase-fold protein [Acidobacteriota bacterium]